MQKEKVDVIFNALDVAGVTISDIAFLSKVSRETLYRWKKGHNITDRLRLDLIYVYALRLNAAVQNDMLPFVEKYKVDERREKLRTIIKKMASK